MKESNERQRSLWILERQKIKKSIAKYFTFNFFVFQHSYVECEYELNRPQFDTYFKYTFPFLN